jgi:sec-independent protein translocase protein TatB
MPQIGWFELLIIVILSIIVIGPKDFPVVLRKIGNWIGTIKRYFSDVQGNINQITNIEDLDKEDSHTNKKINKDDK